MALITVEVVKYGNGAELFYVHDGIQVTEIHVRNPTEGKFSFAFRYKLDELKSEVREVGKSVTEVVFFPAPLAFPMLEVKGIGIDGEEILELTCTTLEGIATGWAPEPIVREEKDR